MDTVVGFLEWLIDFLKKIGWVLVICVLAILLVGFLFLYILPEDTDIEEVDSLKNNCEIVALGQYNDTVSGFRLQRCVVPDGVCYVSSGGGVDCKWEEDK